MYKYAKGGYKKERDRLFSVVSRERIKCGGHKLKHRRVPSEHKELFYFFFTVRVTEDWSRLPGEVPALEMLKGHLDMVMGNLLSVSLLEQGSWTRCLQRSLPASAIL